ncbi:unnamed protein product [Clavelina lepadiformis]|uniref:C3 and PZP-like alpha-2-macroglobulin domain-containing protein 8 n=1 Tax=Clavelina lepadiformis TaxID=159417 RepID=A0ABP0FQV6_CLALP
MNIVVNCRVMDRILWIFCVFLLQAVACVLCFPQSGYILTSPSVFRAGVEHVINVRMFNHVSAVRVNVKLVDLRENIITSVSGEVAGSGSLTLKVPTGHEGKAHLKVCGNCHLNTGFHFSNSTSVTVLNKGASAFIQTDKPVYKPSQTVFANIFMVNRDLKPIRENVTAYVMAPNDVRMMQWKDLTSICCGVVNISFPLSDQPILGEWKIFAEVQGYSYNTTFEIQKYVLPKFDVSITTPPFFRNECEDVIVSANYVFGKPVVGRLEMNMTVHGVGYSKTRFLDIGTPIIQDMSINGEARTKVCLSHLLPEDLNFHFRGSLNIFAKVISEDGNEFVAFDDSTSVSRHLVDIEFTEDTREHFKPGIPFNGKIRASYLDGSPASEVTILLNVEANSENYFRQQIVSNGDGLVTFTVPGLPKSTRVVWIEARIMSVHGERPTDHYLSIHRSLRGWFSPTNCHLLAQGPEGTLTAGEQAQVLIKSSCPCNFTIVYEILSRGNIAQSGSKRVDSGNSVVLDSRRRRAVEAFGDGPIELPSSEDEVMDNHVCQTSLTIDVIPEMSPMARMLVYYVKDDGEGVADSIHLPVKPKLTNEVRVVTSEDQTTPGSEVNLQVTSDPGSCVCLVMVDRSVHLMKPEYMVSPENIFEELETYDLNNLPYEQENAWWRLSRSKRSANMWWNSANSRDAKYAFLESGLVVMTDVVSLNYKASTQLFSHLLTQSMNQAIRSRDEDANEFRSHRHRSPRRKRTFFPETWLWSCFNVSSTGEKNFTVKVPDSITTWQADAVSLHPQSGIGIADAEQLRSFKSFFVDFTLPYSVIRGEEVRIPLTAYNYMDVCAEVSLITLLPPGVSFRHRGSNRLLRTLCVNAQTTETTNVILRFDHLGEQNVSASADAIVGTTSCCHGNFGQRRTVGNDFVTKSVLVEPEGIKREYTHSVYFCPNERINISTPSSYTFQFVRLPVVKTGFNFLAKASNNVHIILSEEDHASSSSYEIVLGGSNNQRSWISRNFQHLVTAATDQILCEDEYRSFWITWTNGNIQVGTGRNQGTDSRFMQWRAPSDTETFKVNYVGFATSEGSSGEFRLWRKEGSNDSFSEIFQLSIPANTVPMSARAVASMIGDVMGPTLTNLNNILDLPFGCGEQNLANFAPNVYILKYLQSTKQLKQSTYYEALQHLQTGYQRQLTYKRSDGSYSAFGDRDSSGSMWLTSFVLKLFSQAKDFIYIDPNELHEAKEWIVSWQQRNGAFPAVGKIWNKDIQAGVDSDVALTAYVTIALLESGLERDGEEIAVMKAKEFLELGVHQPTDSYTAALSAYALTLLGSDFASQALKRLVDKALVDGSHTHWSLKELNFMENAMFGFGDSMKQTVVSAEVEMTSYALLTFVQLHNMSASLPIVKWLSQQRNALGGFSSTQDTCLALQGLSEYAIFSFIGGVNLNVNLASTNLDYERNFVLKNENSEILQTAKIPTLPTTMFVEASGEGCALLQIDVTYNIPDPDSQKAFYIQVRHHALPDVIPHRRRRQSGDIISGTLRHSDDVRYQMEACVRWLHDGSSNMAVLEFNLLTGFRADLESIERMLQSNTINLKRYEISGRSILFYFDEIQSTCRTCVRFVAIKEFDTGRVKPQPVKIYDYYEPGFESEFMYSPSASMMESLCENATDCSSATHAEEYEADCRSSILGCGEEYSECHCSHDCGFEGPPACGSNGVLYINRCRMEAAACELNLRVEEREATFCDSALPGGDEINDLEPELPELSPTDDGQYYYAESDFGSYYSEDNDNGDEVVHPALVMPDNLFGDA